MQSTLLARRLAGYLEDGIALVAALERTAEHAPGASYTHLQDGVEQSKSYAELLKSACLVASGLREAGVRPGDQILLQVRDSWTFVTAFWGALVGGVVPVPMSVPNQFDVRDPLFRKLDAVARLLSLPFALSDTALVGHLRSAGIGVRAVLDVSEVSREQTVASLHYARPSDVAFLSFSHARTDAPRGVWLTHDNLLHSFRQIVDKAALTSQDVAVSWLPYTDDMGLVLFHLLQAVAGMTQVRVSDLGFLRNPLEYLQAITRHRGTLTGISNFGCQHMMESVGSCEMSTLDLSSIRIIYSGEEEVSSSIRGAFFDRFAVTGLSSSVFSPRYGLAEYCVSSNHYPIEVKLSSETLPVVRADGRVLMSNERAIFTSSPVATDAALAPKDTVNMLEWVDLGPPRPGTEIRVVGEDRAVCPQGRVGGIQIKVPRCQEGAGASSLAPREDDWMPTGDLGFLREGSLFVTGREKDVIFANNQEFSSEKVEQWLVDHGIAARDSVAVIGIQEAGEVCERVVVVFAHLAQGEEPRALIRNTIDSLNVGFSFEVEAVLMVPELLKTTSAELRRASLRQKLVQGTFDQAIEDFRALMQEETGRVPPRNELERAVADWLAKRIDVHLEEIDVTESVITFGADSIVLGELAGRMQAVSGGGIELDEFFGHPSIENIAVILKSAGAQWSADGTVRSDRAALVPTGANSHPLSIGQEQLLFLHLMDKLDTSYNEAFMIRVEGRVDPDVFREAVGDLMQAHRALRTGIVVGQRGPEQVVIHDVSPPFEWMDLSEQPDAWDAAVALCKRDLERPFALDEAPLFRVGLIQTGASQYGVYVAAHHIVADAQSFGILFHDLQAFYDHRTHGTPSPPIAQVQPGDHARWQRARLESGELERAQHFWRKEMEGAQRAELPQAPPSEAQDHTRARIATRGFELDSTHVGKLDSFARKRGCTRFHALFAGYLLWLESITGASDLVVGTVVEGRDHEALRNVVGHFANTIPLRVSTDSTLSVEDLMDRVRSATAAALAHASLPYPMIRQATGIEDEVFSSVLVLQSVTLRGRGNDFSVQSPRFWHSATKVDFYVCVWEEAEGLRVECEYDPSRFDDAVVESWSGQLKHVLTTMAEGRAGLSLLSAAQSAVLQQHQSPPVVPEQSPVFERTVVEAFEGAVQQFPGSLAVWSSEGKLTYAELNVQANQLARHLRSIEVKKGDVVGLLLGRSAAAVTAILAILKAGAAYVPLDPSQPSARLMNMIGRAGVRCLVADPQYAEIAGALATEPSSIRHIVWMGGEPEQSPAVPSATGPADVLSESGSDLGVPLSGDDPCYVIFTSGSTGVPKGVLNRHGAIANLVGWVIRAFGYCPGEAIAQFAPFTFDVSVAEILPALCRGLAVHVLPDTCRQSAQEYLQFLSERQIAVATVTPGFLRQLNTEIKAGHLVTQLTSLRLLILGGEALHAADAECFRQAMPWASMVNVYGPTETTVLSTYRFIEASPCSGIVPIGRPIAGTRIYVLDRAERLCPPMTVGEIYIAGEGLAEGYASDPEQTAAAFKEIVFAGNRERVYRTGDFGRITLDGELEFVGRADTQVKIRGHRVELSEVEGALAAHPAVHGAAVVAVPREHGVLALVAYYEAETGLDARELRRTVAEKLPAYMVPAVFEWLEALPLTSNGKVDRKRLPQVDFARTVGVQPYEAPESEEEHYVAALWSQLLGVERPSRLDDFFELGGDSLLAMRLLSELQTKAGAPLDLADLLRDASLKGQSRALRDAGQAHGSDARAPATVSTKIPRLPTHGFHILSAAQRRMYFLQQLPGGPVAYTIPLHMRLSGPLDTERLRRAFEKVVEHHEMLRARIVTTDGVPQQCIEANVTVPFDVSDVRALLAPNACESDVLAERDRLAYQALTQGIDIERAPLFKVRLIRTADEEHDLIWAIHHIIADGRSIEVLLSDLRDAYAGRALDRGVHCSPTYVDFAAWQTQVLANKGLSRELQFWERELEGEIPVLALPYDRVPGQAVGFAGGQSERVLDPVVARAVRDLARRQHTSLFTVMLALYQTFLHRVTGQDDVVVGISAACRERRDLQNVVGLFVNVLPIRSQVSPGTSFVTMLGRQRERLRACVCAQDVPLDRILNRLSLSAEHRRAPLFRTMFNVENVPFEMDLGEARMELVPTNTDTSKFDFLVSYAERPDTIWVRCEYNLALFDHATAQRLFDEYLEEIRRFSAQPSETIGGGAVRRTYDPILASLDRIEQGF